MIFSPFSATLHLPVLQVRVFTHYYKFLISVNKYSFIRHKANKKTLFYGRRDSKKRSVGRHDIFFFFFTFCCQNYPKSLKIMIFSCWRRSQFFIHIFVQKTADFTIFSFKKISANGKKRSVAPVTDFFFLV